MPNVIIRKNAPINLTDFKDYEFFFPLVVNEIGWIDIVGVFKDEVGIEFMFRTSFRPCYDGPILTRTLAEALEVLNKESLTNLAENARQEA